MILGLVIPCYNEQDVLLETTRQLCAVFDTLISKEKISPDSRMYFVDDGSRDRTWQLIVEESVRSPYVKGIKLSRNRGHQNALLAGLFSAAGEAIISLDADLQDDLGAIEQMVDAYHAGNQVVYGVRNSRGTDTIFKRLTARTFYRVMSFLGTETVYDHADYRLLGRTAIESLAQFREVNMFLRGLVPLLGFNTTTVHYDRKERFAGESKYPLRKMLLFAIEGITSFSTVPLRMITLLGIFVALGTMVMSVWTITIKLLNDATIPGWASTVLPTYFLGGVQLFSLGVLGEYLGKIYLEVKGRPRFIVEETC